MGVWEDQRARLSHDLLKNELVPLLSKAIRITEGRVKDNSFEASLPGKIEALGQRLCEGATQIHDTMASSATPALFLGIRPLCQMDDDSKNWLSEVVTKVWIKQKGVDQQRRNIDSAVKRVEDRIRLLAGLESMSPDAKRVALLDLLESVRHLGAHLSMLGKVLPYPI